MLGFRQTNPNIITELIWTKKPLKSLIFEAFKLKVYEQMKE